MKGDISVTGINGGLPMEGEPFTINVALTNTGETIHDFYVHVWVTNTVSGIGCGLVNGTSVTDIGTQQINLGTGVSGNVIWGPVDIALQPGNWYVVAKVYSDISETQCLTGAYQTFVVTAPTVSASITSITVS